MEENLCSHVFSESESLAATAKSRAKEKESECPPHINLRGNFPRKTTTHGKKEKSRMDGWKLAANYEHVKYL